MGGGGPGFIVGGRDASVFHGAYSGRTYAVLKVPAVASSEGLGDAIFLEDVRPFRHRLYHDGSVLGIRVLLKFPVRELCPGGSLVSGSNPESSPANSNTLTLGKFQAEDTSIYHPL